MYETNNMKVPRTSGKYSDWVGVGTATWKSNHGRFTGTFTFNNFKGKGAYVLDDGRKLFGMWYDGCVSGEATWTYPDKSTFKANFQRGNLDGTGVMTFADGTVDNYHHGRVVINHTIYYPDGRRYAGETSEGRPNGYGELKHLDGGTYVGHFISVEEVETQTSHGGYVKEEYKYQGYGTYKYADGNTYQGDWKNGNWDGPGTYTYADGTVYEGHFEQNEFDPDGTWSFPNGDTYSGEWVDNEIQGEGTYTFKDGKIYSGQFYKGLHHGQGKMWSDDDYWEGEWKMGERIKDVVG